MQKYALIPAATVLLVAHANTALAATGPQEEARARLRQDIEAGLSGRKLLHPQHANFNDVRTRQDLVHTALLTAMVRF